MKKVLCVIFYTASVHYVNSRGRHCIKRFEAPCKRLLRIAVERYENETSNRILKIRFSEMVWYDPATVDFFCRKNRGHRITVTCDEHPCNS